MPWPERERCDRFDRGRMSISGETTDSADAPEGASGIGARAWLHDVMVAMRMKWWWMPAMLLAALVLTTLYLRQADYRYSAELRVHAAPSSSGTRPTSALGGLAALTGLGGASEQVSPFRFYLDGIYAAEVAERLSHDDRLMHRLFVAEWDPQRRMWRQPPSLAGSLRRGITGMFGLPQVAWQPPGAARLQDLIVKQVSVRQSVKSPLVGIGYSHPDPVFAVHFLERLHATVDGYLREQQSLRTRENIRYLSEKLQTVTLSEQRQALVTALAEQERQAMLVYSNAPYAAEPFDVPTASAEPTQPRAIPLLAGAAVAGLLLGGVLAAILGGRAMRRMREPDAG